MIEYIFQEMLTLSNHRFEWNLTCSPIDTQRELLYNWSLESTRDSTLNGKKRIQGGIRWCCKNASMCRYSIPESIHTRMLRQVWLKDVSVVGHSKGKQLHHVTLDLMAR